MVLPKVYYTFTTTIYMILSGAEMEKSMLEVTIPFKHTKDCLLVLTEKFCTAVWYDDSTTE